MDPRAQVVIRLKPWTVDGLRGYAETGLNERIDDKAEPVYSLSVLVATGPEGVRTALAEIPENLGSDPIAIVPAEEVAHFRLEATPSKDMPSHHDLILGRDLIADDLEVLSGIFKTHRRRNR